MAPLRIHTFTLATILKIMCGICILFAVLWYASFQARLLIQGPNVSLEEVRHTPEDPRVTIQGIAQNATVLMLNGKHITTDETGVFKESLVLPPGYTIMELYAEDRYGRTTNHIEHFYTNIN